MAEEGWRPSGARMPIRFGRIVVSIAVALVVVSAVVLLRNEDGQGDRQSVRLERLLRLRTSGVVIRFPRDWRASTRNLTPVDNPALCVTLRRKLARDRSMEVALVEYLPPELDRAELQKRPNPEFPPRPEQFDLRMLQASDNRWTSGRTLTFQERGRAFFVGVVLPRGSAAEARDEIAAILDGLQIGAGRCRPSRGVGA